MNGNFRKNRAMNRMGRLSAAVLIAAGFSAWSAGCHSDETGHTRTTTKRTVETPSGKSTVTETHEKKTTIDPH